jgi:hypothetical protein
VGPNGLVLNVPYFKTAELNVETIVRLLSEMREAQVTAIDVRQDVTDGYFAWMKTQFGKFSWGSPSCNSYYTNAEGHAPFLFPGNFKLWVEFQATIGLDDFNVVAGRVAETSESRESKPWSPSQVKQV